MQASVTDLVQNQVALTPQAIAVVCGRESISYSELNRRANKMACLLQSRGVHEGAFVSLCLSRSIAQVVAILAILKTGAAYVPLDPSYPAERLAFMLQDCGARVLLTENSLADALPIRRMDTVHVSAIEGKVTGSTREPAARPTGASPAYVVYTSGSTGKPKGIVMPHNALVNLLEWQREILPEPARTIQFAPASFDVSFQEIFSTWSTGGTLVLIDEMLRRDPVRLWNFVVQEEINRLFLPFVALHGLAEAANGPSALRDVITAGEQLRITPPIRRMFNRLRSCRLHNHYGPSETHVVTALTLAGAPNDWPALPPIGCPIANTEIRLLNEQGSADQIGELYIGGECLCRGYLNQPQLNAEKFVTLDGGGRFYRSGDLGRWLWNGNIEFLGRADDQVKVRGYRVELGEIEIVLSEHPSVRDVAVALKPDAAGHGRLIAYIVSKEFCANALREFTRQRLPEYLVPSLFEPIDKLPLTPSGKVDRRALPEPAAGLQGQVFVPPRDALEEQLVEIWQKVLNVPSIGITDDFFELGGDSLMAVQIFLGIEKVLEKNFPLATLFEAPTVEQLAAALRREDREPRWSPLVPIQSRGSRAPFFGVHGDDGQVLFYRLLARVLGPDQPFYGLQSQGLDGRRIRYRSIVEMAANYLKEVRRLQPHGPYFLGGYCFGGVVAFEMAQQLQAAGEKIALLALFDAPNPARPPRPYTFIERINLRWHEASLMPWRRRLRYFLRRGSDKIGVSFGKGVEQVRQILCRATRFAAEPLPVNLRGLHVRSAHNRMMRSYQPGVYAGRITLFRAGTPTGNYESSLHLGWNKIAEEGIEIYNVPGSHEMMFSEPHVQKLAEKLAFCVEKALRKSVYA